MALEHAEVRKLVLDVYAQGSTIAVGGVRVEQRVNTILGTLDTDRDGVVSMAEFVAFNQQHPMLLFPAFRLQLALREGIAGRTFWEVTAARRLAEAGKGKGAGGVDGASVRDLTQVLEGRTLADYRAAMNAFGSGERYVQWRDEDRVQEKVIAAREAREAKRRHKRERAEYQRSLKLQRQAKKEAAGAAGSAPASCTAGADGKSARTVELAAHAKAMVQTVHEGKAKVVPKQATLAVGSSRNRVVPVPGESERDRAEKGRGEE